MPPAEPDDDRRRGRLLNALFWAGVGLAPLAGLLLLLGNGNAPLKVAAVLAVLAVVLIGLSITLRADATTVRIEMEETLLDEVDMLREDVREDITTAARATHKAFGERLQALHETVEALRAELASVRAAASRPAYHEPAPQPPPVVHPVSAPVHAGAHPHGGVPGPVPPRMPHVGVEAGNAHRPGHPGGRAHVPAGVLRHTETVQVTTRSTFVDPADDGDRGKVYGGRGDHDGGRDWAAPAPRGRSAPDEESWTDQRLRERYGQSRDAGRRSRSPDRDDPGDDERWAGMRAGDRWTEIRDDDRGRELRMGERRAAVHSDETGTELRIEDRWAAVRRRDDESRDERWSRALPAGSGGGESRGGRRRAESDWESSWADAAAREPVRESRGRRRRAAADDDDDYRHPASGVPQRRFDFELSDERWR